VPWHQDVTIAVRERVDAAGFGPWSIKQGVTHVQPPSGILAQMISVRLHLDDCPECNGALRVLPGSHAAGKLTAAQVDLAVRSRAPVVCEVGAGGALLMRPLLLHASPAAREPGHRRVVHLDFAAHPLPCGLHWHESNAV
jgi:ectoine hydroxylase-related dioxygenase (phytanoyl-CoA dioxygenase family)